MSSIRWPSVEAKAKVNNVPSLREDLFAGCFQKKLQEEVSRRETLAKSEFRTLAEGRPHPYRPRENRPFRGGQVAPQRNIQRGSLCNRAKGRFSSASRPGFDSRGASNSRGNPTSMTFTQDFTVAAPPTDCH